MIDLVWLALRKAPPRLWVGVGLVMALLACGLGVRAAVRGVRAAERRAVLAEAAAVDSGLLKLQRAYYVAQLDSVRGVADRLRDSVEVRVKVVERWVPLLPDSLRKIPAVDSLVRACTRLAKDCDSLRVASARVDTVTKLVERIDSTRVRALSLRVVQLEGALAAKSCRKGVALGVLGGAAVGWMGGRR